MRLSVSKDEMQEKLSNVQNVLVHVRGASIVDARVRVEPAQAPEPLGARR